MATDFEEFSDLDAGFGKRIDELLASAVEDQARDQRLLIETLERAQLETSRLRELIEARQDSVADVLEARLAGMATDEGVREISDSVQKHLDEMRDVLDRLDPWKAAMVVQRTLAERFSEMSSSLAEQLSETKSLLTGQIAESTSSLSDGLGATTSSLGSALDDSSSELKEAVQSIGARSFDRLVQIQEDLQNMGTILNEIPARVSQKFDQLRSESRTAAAANSRQMEQIVSRVGSRLDEDRAIGQKAMAAVSRQMEGLREAIEEQPPRLSDEIQASVEPFAEEIRNLSARVRRSNMKSSDLVARLDALHQSLVAYLAQRDERLERTRDAVLAQLVEGIGRQLQRGDRVKIAEALRRANRARRDRRDAERYRKLMASAPALPDHSKVERELEKVEPEPRPKKRSPKPPEPPPRAASGAKRRRKPAV